jgi:tetratricopeptide (TPR) repeat protein
LEQAKARDPDYRRTYEFLSWVLREQGLFAESTDAMDKVYEIDSQGGNGKATIDYYKKFNSQLRNAASMNGALGYWRTMADSDLTINSGPYFSAVAYAKLGEKDEAFKCLEKAFEQHYSGLVWLKVDPALEDLRQDPRYEDMLKRIGLK